MLPLSQYEPSAEALAEIRRRLAGVCKDYSDSELDSLVREIAYVRDKYDRMKTEGFFSGARALAAETRSRQRSLGLSSRAD